MNIQVQVDVVDCIVKYLYNVRKDEIFAAVYGRHHDEGYAMEKMRLMNNLSQFWGELDIEHRERLVKAANDYYENRKL